MPEPDLANPSRHRQSRRHKRPSLCVLDSLRAINALDKVKFVSFIGSEQPEAIGWIRVAQSVKKPDRGFDLQSPEWTVLYLWHSPVSAIDYGVGVTFRRKGARVFRRNDATWKC